MTPTLGYKHLNVRLPSATDARLRAAAAERLVNPSIIVARAVESFLDALTPLPTTETRVVDTGEGAAES